MLASLLMAPFAFADGPKLDPKQIAAIFDPGRTRDQAFELTNVAGLKAKDEVVLSSADGKLLCKGKVDATDATRVTFASGCETAQTVPLTQLQVKVGKGPAAGMEFATTPGKQVRFRGGDDGGLDVDVDSTVTWLALVSSAGLWIVYPDPTKAEPLSGEEWTTEMGTWLAEVGGKMYRGDIDGPRLVKVGDGGGRNDPPPPPPPRTEPLCDHSLLDNGPFFRVDLQDPSRGRAPDVIIRPNTPIDVCVVAPVGATVGVELTGGTRGLYEAPIDMRNQAQSGSTRSGTAYAETRATFAPRLPGSSNLLISVTDGNGKVTKTTFELEVEKLYAGAVRVGIGIPYTPFARDYGVATTPGSSTAEIVENSGVGTHADVELVVGFAPFLNKGGRGYYSAEDRATGFWRVLGQHVAPYVAIGMIDSDTESALDLLQTVYVGAEYEFNPHASVALTGIMRQSEVLRGAYSVGGPAGTATDADITTTQYQPGIALVLNVSPEFLKAARTGVATSRIAPQ